MCLHILQTHVWNNRRTYGMFRAVAIPIEEEEKEEEEEEEEEKQNRID